MHFQKISQINLQVVGKGDSKRGWEIWTFGPWSVVHMGWATLGLFNLSWFGRRVRMYWQTSLTEADQRIDTMFYGIKSVSVRSRVLDVWECPLWCGACSQDPKILLRSGALNPHLTGVEKSNVLQNHSGHFDRMNEIPTAARTIAFCNASIRCKLENQESASRRNRASSCHLRDMGSQCLQVNSLAGPSTRCEYTLLMT